MSIRLESTPSTDGLGVKRWTYPLDAEHTLHVFERPNSEITGRTRFMLRLLRGEAHVGTDYAATKADAARQARYIARDVAERMSEPAYQTIIRATHERGVRQTLALEALDKRGLWLSAEQREQAGLAPAST